MNSPIKLAIRSIYAVMLLCACSSDNGAAESYERDVAQFRMSDFELAYDLAIAGSTVGEVMMAHADGASGIRVVGLRNPVDGLRVSWQLQRGTQTTCISDTCETTTPNDDGEGFLGMGGATHPGVRVESRVAEGSSACYVLSLREDATETWEECYESGTLTRASGLGARLFMLLLDVNLPPNSTPQALFTLRDNAALELNVRVPDVGR